MTKADPRKADENSLLDGLRSEGDGRGIGPTLGPDVSVEAERREIERGVFARRTTPRGPTPEAPSFEPITDSVEELARPAAPGGTNEQQSARRAHAQAQGEPKTQGA